MAKRFFDTTKWDDSWFRNLKPEYKCFWEFIISKCDNSGVWKKDIEYANYNIKSNLEEKEILTAINNNKERIKILDNDNYWLVVDFISFQFGQLKNESRPHQSILELIDKHKSKGYLYPMDRVLDRVKDKDKDKDKDVIVVKDVEVKESNSNSNSNSNKIIKEKKNKEITPQAEFVDNFANLYKYKTNQSYLMKKEHYIIIANLLKKFTIEEVIKKTEILTEYCEQGKIWFCKNGWSDFLIEKLSTHWNSLIPLKKENEKSWKDILREINNG